MFGNVVGAALSMRVDKMQFLICRQSMDCPTGLYVDNGYIPWSPGENVHEMQQLSSVTYTAKWWFLEMWF